MTEQSQTVQLHENVCVCVCIWLCTRDLLDMNFNVQILASMEYILMLHVFIVCMCHISSCGYLFIFVL